MRSSFRPGAPAGSHLLAVAGLAPAPGPPARSVAWLFVVANSGAVLRKMTVTAVVRRVADMSCRTRAQKGGQVPESPWNQETNGDRAAVWVQVVLDGLSGEKRPIVNQ
ncbi:C-_U-Editing Enzyme Apobec-4-Like [Manis pentadactyla]|nr:C->U-Editing Enzyme Apobec-4-Like [Manis pentadactyla]